MQEIWKDIKGYEGLYQVSSFGRVKSLKRKHKLIEFILKSSIQKNGYSYVGLSKNNKNKNITIHRLVASTFINNLEDKPQVNHKDGNKQNNCLENLEWMTKSENIKHSFDYLNKKSHLTGKIGILNPLSKPVLQYNLNGEFIREWENARCITRELKFNYIGIGDCCRGKRKRMYGYIWKYKKFNK